MASSAFRVHGAGCGLADLILPPVDFSSQRFDAYRSHRAGDGGLALGCITFKEDLIRYSGKPWEEIRSELLRDARILNAGGPGMVSMAVAAQLLRPSKIPVVYHGFSGDDATGAQIRHVLAQTPLDISGYRQRPGSTPVTWVFHDPSAQGGHGERFFLHDPGTAVFDDNILGEPFFQATFNVYAGTALVPPLHAQLPQLLAKGRRRGALNIVGAMHDAYAEVLHPGRLWGFGEGDAYPSMDLLVADSAELHGLTGDTDIPSGVQKLLDQGLAAAVITQGPDPVYYRSLGGIFGVSEGWVPALPEIVVKSRDRNRNPGDTTGAGDNFLAGLIADFCLQIFADDFFTKGEMHVERELLQIVPLRLRHAVDFGIAAGGLACLQSGGLKLEKASAERLHAIRALLPQPLPAGRPW